MLEDLFAYSCRPCENSLGSGVKWCEDQALKEFVRRLGLIGRLTRPERLRGGAGRRE